MPALPSRVASLDKTTAALVTTNTALVRETSRVADLPGNIIRLFVFVRNLFNADTGNALCPSTGKEATEQSEEGQSRGDFLDGFLRRDDNQRAREGIEELGLVRGDLLDIVDVICERRFDRFRRALLQTASEPATAAQASAGGPVAPSAKVTSPKEKG